MPCGDLSLNQCRKSIYNGCMDFIEMYILFTENQTFLIFFESCPGICGWVMVAGRDITLVVFLKVDKLYCSELVWEIKCLILLANRNKFRECLMKGRTK